jgi:hypothetical protein
MNKEYFNTIVLNTLAMESYIQENLDLVVLMSEDRIDNAIVLSVRDGDIHFQRAYSYAELEQIVDPLILAKRFVEDYNNGLQKVRGQSHE